MIQRSYLLDSCVFIDSLRQPGALPKAVLKIIQNTQNQIFVSDASLWEIGIKMHKGKLRIGKYQLEDVMGAITAQEFYHLPIAREEIVTATTLPRHHDDPFDRLLLAQAMHHEMILISPDEIFSAYTKSILW